MWKLKNIANSKICSGFRPVDRYEFLIRFCGFVAPHIHNFVTRWQWMVSFAPLPFYFGERRHCVLTVRVPFTYHILHVYYSHLFHYLQTHQSLLIQLYFVHTAYGASALSEFQTSHCRSQLPKITLIIVTNLCILKFNFWK